MVSAAAGGSCLGVANPPYLSFWLVEKGKQVIMETDKNVLFINSFYQFSYLNCAYILILSVSVPPK